MVDPRKGPGAPGKDCWRTPPRFVEALERRFCICFTLDPCAVHDNHLGIRDFYTVEDDGLSKPWGGCVWVNPPYSEKWVWVRKAFLESEKRGVDAWVLLEACVDSARFHSWAPLAETYLLRGRIRFLNDELKPLRSGFRGYMLMRFSHMAWRGRISLLDIGGYRVER